MSDNNLITDELDLLNEVKECVKAVGGSVIECCYVLDKHIIVAVDNPNEVELEFLQDEIDSWGNIPIKYMYSAVFPSLEGNRIMCMKFEVI